MDGRPLTIERGAGGDLQVAWGDDGLFHLDPERLVLSCWSAGAADERWQRVLLDSALASAALALGADALHAGAAVLERGAVAVMGATGAGKTSLVAELVARGSQLLCDDVLAVEATRDGPVGHPAPAVMNLPRKGPASAAAQRLGTVLAHLDGEAWVAVRRTARAPAPLQALVWLERGQTRKLRVERLAPHPAPILVHLLDSGSAPDRRARRFAVAAELAERVPLLRLRAPAGIAPLDLAGALQEALADIGVK